MKRFLLFVVVCGLVLVSGLLFGAVRSQGAKHAFWRQTGHPHGWPGHIVDHILPLACGGADQPSNMQWLTIAQAKAKDKWEIKGDATHPPCSGRRS